MFEIFSNGSAKVNRRLMLIELALSSLLMAIVLVQGYLPSQDWIPVYILKPLAFGLATFGALLKASEMFFSKAAAMFSNDKQTGAVKSGDTIITKAEITSSTTVTNPNPTEIPKP